MSGAESEILKTPDSIPAIASCHTRHMKIANFDTR